MSSRWFRYYDDALNDPKVQALRPDLFKAWVNLLCVASRNGGAIPSLGEASFGLRLPDSRAAVVVTELARAKLLDKVEGGYFAPHNWSGRQFKSDKSNDRVAAFRERQKQQRSDVTSNVTETANETPPETDTESETEKTETRASARAVEEAFKRFREAYPKRDGANPWEPARKKFAALLKSSVDAEAIIAGAQRYADECQRKGLVGTDKVAQATTFLSQRRWEDYPAPRELAAEGLPGFYARAESEELAAWHDYGKATRGRTYPTDKNGGWQFPMQWPPGHPNHKPEVE